MNISWWEHAKRNLPDRVVVVGLIQVLQRYNGIRALEEANRLLFAADYRALDVTEIEQIASTWKIPELTIAQEQLVEESSTLQLPRHNSRFYQLLERVFHLSEMDEHARSRKGIPA